MTAVSFVLADQELQDDIQIQAEAVTATFSARPLIKVGKNTGADTAVAASVSENTAIVSRLVHAVTMFAKRKASIVTAELT